MKLFDLAPSAASYAPALSLTVPTPCLVSGMRFEEVGDDAEEVFRIRGYRLDVKAHEVWESMEEGKVIDGAA